jgi:hypothetical protein
MHGPNITKMVYAKMVDQGVCLMFVDMDMILTIVADTDTLNSQFTKMLIHVVQLVPLGFVTTVDQAVLLINVFQVPT